MKYGLHGKLQAKSGKGEELSRILLEASRLAMVEHGCHLYLVSRDVVDADALWITEVWDTKEDHDQSLQDQRVREVITRARPLLDGPPEKGQELIVLGGRAVE